MKKKEFGSDFELYLNKNLQVKKKKFFDIKKSSFFLSGRSALFAIIKHGVKNHQWKTVYLPTFYCQEVNRYIKKLPIKISFYDYNPFLESKTKDFNLKDDKSNVVVNVNFFGFDKLDLSVYTKLFVIEDLTHNLLSISSSIAHYTFGSLRKELPVPVGGFLNSKNLPIPKGLVCAEANNIAIQKLTAMYLKSQYLKGKLEDKSLFRKLFLKSEHDLELNLKNAKMPEIARTIFLQLDILKILKQKIYNLKIAYDNLKIPKSIIVNQGFKKNSFGLMLILQLKEQRDRLSNHLINNNIYPTILWPNQKTELNKKIEQQILFIHIDFRYSEEDIIYITNKINSYFQNEKL